jgi:TolA-binding protein
MVLKKKSFNKSKASAVLFLVLAGSSYSRAQVHTPFLSHNQWLTNAGQLLAHELYPMAAFSAANHLSQRFAFYLDHDPVLQKDRAEYLYNVSKIRYGSDDLKENNTANPAYRERMAFAKAQYYFHRRNWAAAIPYYQQAGIANLSNKEVAETKFELAYAYFNNKQFAESEALLASIKDIDGSHAPSANYYYGLLAYNKGNFADALKSFEKIEQHKEYKAVVPYYMAEVLYFNGERGKALLKVKEELAKNEKSYYDNEFHLLAAQCLFEERKYTEAIPYFEYYYSNVDKIRKQDMYKMAYSYYRTEQWQKAIEPFQQLSTVQDTLGQASMYYLGDCYLKTNDKTGAKNAFSICSQMPFDEKLVEQSLLLSGKLSFELGYSAEGSAQIRKLLNEFPESVYRSEATNILSQQLLRTGNYSEAYQMLSAIDAPSRILVQKSAYGYALQNLQQNNRIEAERLLDESLQNSENNSYEAAAYFWKAEIDYHNKNYTAALNNGKSFLAKNNSDVPSVSPDATLQHAMLTLGYAALNTEDFAQSRTYFAQAQNKQNTAGYSAKLAADAALREADAAFLEKDYARASELYSKTIAQNTTDADYARFQKSTLLGLQGKSSEQVELLTAIVSQRNPESRYRYEAHYALGDLYLDANKYEDAISHFQKINDNTARHLAAKALMKTAFAYQEADNDDKAIETYRDVLRKYPNSDQRNGALEALKDLYVSTNQPNTYVQLLKENNLAATDNAGLDSLFYAAAEIQFAGAKYSKATEAMRNYLQQYPQGAFRTKASFYKAESHYQLKEYDSALKGYELVLQEAWSDFTEPSAIKAAALAFAQNNFTAAERYYGILRNNAIGKDNLKVAYRGLMLSAKNMNNLPAAGNYADTLLTIPELDEQSKNEALLIKGNTAAKDGKYDEANSFYTQLNGAKNIEIAAEAIYKQAELLVLQNKIADAEKATGKAIQQTSGSSYWNTKAYLLMADIFVAQKDYFNAKATLQSLVKNVKHETLRKEAAGKLEQVKTLEKGKSKLSEG